MLACKHTRNLSNTNLSEDNKYEILKITPLSDNVYAIYAQRNDSIFKIFSKKDIILPINCNMIAVGGKYDLLLQSILHNESLFPRYTMVSHINFGGTPISIRKDSSIVDLCTAKNLNGLCIY